MENLEDKLISSLISYNSYVNFLPIYDKKINEAKDFFSLKNKTTLEKYKFTKQIKRIFLNIGMGHPLDNTSYHEKFIHNKYYEIKNIIDEVLMKYWCELGNEYHASNEFKILKVGNIIELIPDKILWISERDERIMVDIRLTFHKWKVESYNGNDITNMPFYYISNEEKQFRPARHEAIKVIE